MTTLNLLYQDKLRINDSISVAIPKVGAIIENEDSYYNLVSIFTAMPIDFMCQLDDAGIDFTSVNEYDLFLLLFDGIKNYDTKLILGNLDLSKFKFAVDNTNGNMVLRDEDNDIVIDREIHNQIAMGLRRIHHLEKNKRKPANDEAKKYMLKRARDKLNRRSRRVQESQLEPLIIAMVNTEQYKYDFEGTKELSIYQFNESVRQVVRKVDYDNTMYGVYSGSIDIKSLSQESLNWFTNK